MVKIDYISDIHIDSYIKYNIGKKKTNKEIKLFIKNILRPINDNILLIPGDISHYNSQIRCLFDILRNEYYNNIIFTIGNHELYLLDKRYKSSFERLDELKNMVDKMDNVHLLDGNIVNVNGINIGGIDMYSDNNGLSQKDLYIYEWILSINDYKYINFNEHYLAKFYKYGYNKTIEYFFDPLKYFNKQYKKLNNIKDKCDIILTHIPPFYMPSKKFPKDNSSTFFYFDGKKLFNKNIKYWFFGHVHESYKINKQEIKFLCNPLGYNNEMRYISIESIDFI